MTCIEYLKQTRPEYVGVMSIGTLIECSCPSDYMDISDPGDCESEDCKECWEREFVEKDEWW